LTGKKIDGTFTAVRLSQQLQEHTFSGLPEIYNRCYKSGSRWEDFKKKMNAQIGNKQLANGED
jgi:hypothetical protein